MKFNSYRDLKERFAECVILILAGYFYEAREDDAFVINNIFGYKLYMESYKNIKRLKTGFPVWVLDKVLSGLDDCTINYIVVEKYEIAKKRVELNNQYRNYIQQHIENTTNDLYRQEIHKEITPLNNKPMVKLNSKVKIVDKETGVVETFKFYLHMKR